MSTRSFNKIIKTKLENILGPRSISFKTLCNQTTITVKKIENITKVVSFLKEDHEMQFQILLSICGVDFPNRKKSRFEVIYNFLSITQNHRIRIKLNVGENEIIDSIEKIYSAATWYEREIWDMYGIKIKGNQRRILTDYGFEGHPLRKDFPMSGNFEVYYNEETKQIERRNVSLLQDYRDFT